MRGGRRPGAGRKPTSRTEVIYLRISKEAKEELIKLCESVRMSPSEYFEGILKIYKQ